MWFLLSDVRVQKQRIRLLSVTLTSMWDTSSFLHDGLSNIPGKLITSGCTFHDYDQ